MFEERIPTVNGTEPAAVVAKETAYKSASEATELIRIDAGDITATNVTLEQSGAEQITSDRVGLDRSGAKSITTKSAILDRSGVLLLKGANVVLQQSSAVVVNAQEARIVKSKVLFFRSHTTTIEGELKTLIHIGQAGDQVKPVLNATDAVRFGAAFGFVFLVVGRLLRRLPGGR